MVALQVLSYRSIVTINVLWLFLTVPWVGLQCVIVVFPDHTYFLKVKTKSPKFETTKYTFKFSCTISNIWTQKGLLKDKRGY